MRASHTQQRCCPHLPAVLEQQAQLAPHAQPPVMEVQRKRFVAQKPQRKPEADGEQRDSGAEEARDVGGALALHD